MELRKHLRYTVQCLASFTQEGGPSTQGTVTNLSAGGCAIESDAPVSKGAYINLKITLPDQAALVSIELAAVRWTTRREFGVEFIMRQKEDQERLDRFITMQPRSEEA